MKNFIKENGTIVLLLSFYLFAFFSKTFQYYSKRYKTVLQSLPFDMSFGWIDEVDEYAKNKNNYFTWMSTAISNGDDVDVISTYLCCFTMLVSLSALYQI